MLALYRCGRQAEALEAYREARAGSSTSSGIEPGAELQELERAILRQDPSWRRRGTGPRPPPAANRAAGRSRPRSARPRWRRSRDLGEPLCRERRPRARAGRDRRRARTSSAALSESLREIAAPLARPRRRGPHRRLHLGRRPGATWRGSPASRTSTCCSSTRPPGCSRTRACSPCSRTRRATSRCWSATSRPARARSSSRSPGRARLGGGRARRLDRAGARPARCGWRARAPGPSGRDASRLLASASLALQRALGVQAEPLIVEPDAGGAGAEAARRRASSSSASPSAGAARASVAPGPRSPPQPARRPCSCGGACGPAASPRAPATPGSPGPSLGLTAWPGDAQAGAAVRGERGRQQAAERLVDAGDLPLARSARRRAPGGSIRTSEVERPPGRSRSSRTGPPSRSTRRRASAARQPAAVPAGALRGRPAAPRPRRGTRSPVRRRRRRATSPGRPRVGGAGSARIRAGRS